MKLDWSFDPKPDVDATNRERVVEALQSNWSTVGGSELGAVTLPIRLTGAKGRRLLVLVKADVAPPWGTWTTLADDERRWAFTAFRTAVNGAIAPLELITYTLFSTPYQLDSLSWTTIATLLRLDRAVWLESAARDHHGCVIGHAPALPDGFLQCVQLEWFAQDAKLRRGRLHHVAIAAGQQNRYPRITIIDFLCQGNPVHRARHHNVAENERDLRPPVQPVQSVRGIGLCVGPGNRAAQRATQLHWQPPRCPPRQDLAPGTIG